MSTTTPETTNAIDAAAELPEEARTALRDLILALADSKRMLGLHYSDRMLGAPSLEAGIAASSMAQDEWGHARLTYAVLSDFGDEPKALEHERQADAYRSMDVLDQGFDSWSAMIAAALLIDTALTTQYWALAESRYRPIYNRVQKLIDEEGFHYQYAAGWARRIGAAPGMRAEFIEALRARLAPALRWFGRTDDARGQALVAEGIVRASADDLRHHFLAQVAPVLAEAGIAGEIGLEHDEARGGRYSGALDWSDWNDTRRRAGGHPGEELVARARGDKNRALLMD
jgi:ring-1,2-phenylacetyl-CoA epoxidase subunit PaaC